MNISKRLIIFLFTTFSVILLTNCNLLVGLWGGPDENTESAESVPAGGEENPQQPGNPTVTPATVQDATPTNAPAATPTAVVTREPTPVPDLITNLHFETDSLKVNVGDGSALFDTNVYVTLTENVLSIYKINIDYNDAIIDVYTHSADGSSVPWVEEVYGGIVDKDNFHGNNKLTVDGSHPYPGIGPGEDLHLLIIHWEFIQDTDWDNASEVEFSLQLSAMTFDNANNVPLEDIAGDTLTVTVVNEAINQIPE